MRTARPAVTRPISDIDWNSPEERLRNRILLPVLSDHYGRVLAAGEIRLERQEGHFLFRYHDQTFPAAPESLAGLLAKAADREPSSELGFLADSLAQLRQSPDAEYSSLLVHDRNKEVLRKLLSRLCTEQPAVAQRIDQAIREINQNVDELDAVLSQQHYRLSRWRTAESELVYRRFFDINSMVGIRTENEYVFADTHRLILEWVKAGQVDGLRVDHPDGLQDPKQYFQRLSAAAPKTWIVAEKILAPGESLPCTWDIAGTTGYDFLNLAGGLFVDPRGEAALNELISRVRARARGFSCRGARRKRL